MTLLIVTLFTVTAGLIDSILIDLRFAGQTIGRTTFRS